MSARWPVAGALLLAASACGARTSIDVEGDGVGGGASSIGAGGDAGAPSAAVGGGGGGPRCEPETFGGPRTAGAQRIEVDATHAYWTTTGGRLVRAAFGGGAEEELLGDLQDVGDLALDGDRVVLAAEGRIVAVPKVGGPPVILVEDVDGVVTLVADASGIYWMAGGSGIVSYTLERLAPDGARSVLVAPIGFGIGVALTATDVVFTAETLGGSDALGLVARVPKEGGAVELLASDRPDPTNVFVRGDDVFWTEQLDVLGGPVGVVRLAPDAASPERILTAPAGSLPILSAATPTTVVMTALDVERGAMLLAAPIGGGEAVLLAEDEGVFLEPATTEDRVAVTVQPAVDDRDDTAEHDVRVVCP